jgi:hypothetical protein
MTIVDIIQSMLAPGIMISACGLLLLGMNSKYSMVVNRIRVLDEEKRKLAGIVDTDSITEMQKHRYHSVCLQLKKLAFRIKLVRNAVIFYSIAVALFIISCLSIGLQYMLNEMNISGTVVLFFLAGMISVFTGIIFACLEVLKGYEIIRIEINES